MPVAIQVPPPVPTLKQELEALYGDRLEGVYLYGSYARGTATGDSDIDLLVVLQGPVRPGREIRRMNPVVSKACLEHDVLISVLPVSKDHYSKRESPFLLNVRREAVAV